MSNEYPSQYPRWFQHRTSSNCSEHTPKSSAMDMLAWKHVDLYLDGWPNRIYCPPHSCTGVIVSSRDVCATIKGHKQPELSFRVCTRVFSLHNSCIWMEEPMPASYVVAVVRGSLHEVIPLMLTDQGVIGLIDFSIEQFVLSEGSVWKLYT